MAGSTISERKILSPSEYARRFKEGKKRLKPVEAALKTSYDLLTEERRRLWRLLAMFPETFDAKAAAADLMQVLVDYERELDHPDAEKHAAQVDAIWTRLAAQGS